jgi:hypothetical protein
VACRRMRSAAGPRTLAALAGGCAKARAAVPSLDPAGFFIALREGLYARQGLHRRGQQLADTSRSAAERATEAPPPSGPIRDIAALISLDSYPAGVVRIHRAAGVMRQFPGAAGSTSCRRYRGIYDGRALEFPDCAARRSPEVKVVSWVLSGADRVAGQSS